LYHNLTTHYNVYFNGEKSYKEGVKKAESDIEDNFNLILPVFLYYNENISQSVFSNMDRAVKKATKAITLHSITAKPEIKKGEITEQDKEFFERNEYNKWIDDSYLLIGKSYMFQQEYGLAKDAFKHVINKYPYESTVYNAKIWLTRCYNAKNSFKESEMMINTLHNDAEFPKKLKGDLDISIADYYIKQNKYDEAIPYLEKALKTIRKKYYRIRYTYILGQLYQKTNNHKQSFDTYGKVIKMNPPYLMTFNAKINRAGVFNAQAGDSREIKTQLYKMLKDDKNIDYRDQIYYALGNVSYKEGNIGEAVENYKKSVQASQGNSNQIALSYKKLASIYYERSDYEEAQVYYDSTLTFIGQEYPDYKTIYARAKVLNKLVNYLHAVHQIGRAHV